MKPEWKYDSMYYLPAGQCAVYRDDRLGIQLQVVECSRHWLFRARNRYIYFIDGVKKSFANEDQLMRALRRVRHLNTHPLQ